MAKPVVVSLQTFRNRELIALCEELLQMAKDGRFRSMGFLIDLDGGKHHGVVGPWRQNHSPLIGELAIFQARLTSLEVGEREEAEECLN